MLKEEELLSLIKYTTGKELGEYGFVSGTKIPHEPKGMVSSNMYEGFEVWRKDPEGVLRINESDYGKTLAYIINFLKD